MAPQHLQTAARALWVAVIPALLAALTIKYLVPPIGIGLPGVLSLLVKAFPAPFAVVLFLGLSAMARHWRFHLPGGRYASRLPAGVAPEERDPGRLREWAEVASLRDALESKGTAARLARMLDEPRRAEVARGLEDLRGAVETSDLDAARRAATSVRAIARPTLAARAAWHAGATLAGLGLAVGSMVGVRARFAQVYQVLSGSMLPTLDTEDRILGHKHAYGAGAEAPRRGDVIIFRSQALPDLELLPVAQPEILVKRVIGIPGDRIAMDGGTPIINGWQVPTCSAGPYMHFHVDGDGGVLRGGIYVEFLEDRAYLTIHSLAARRFNDTFVVPSGQVFVLGDSRGNSVDSRAYGGGHGGGVPASAIDARADWFLTGTRMSGSTDFSRLLRPMRAVEGATHVEAFNAADLEAGIRQCLANRPEETHPPVPSEPTAEAAPAPTSG